MMRWRGVNVHGSFAAQHRPSAARTCRSPHCSPRGAGGRGYAARARAAVVRGTSVDDSRSFRRRPSRRGRSRTAPPRPTTGPGRRASNGGASRLERPARWGWYDRGGASAAAFRSGGGGGADGAAKFDGSTVRAGHTTATQPPKAYRAVGSGDGQGSPPAAPVGTASCASRDRCGTALTLRERQMAANGRSFVVQLPRTPLKSVPSAGL